VSAVLKSVMYSD